MDPDLSYEALKELGNQSFKAGDPKQAIEFFTRAIALQPNEVQYPLVFLTCGNNNVACARLSTRIVVFVTVLSSNGREVSLMPIKP